MATKKNSTPRKPAYEVYLEERKELVAALREGSQTFDKAILTFASGAFGFTIAFLKDVASKPFANTMWLLAGSWILFSLSLISILISFLLSQKACEAQIELSHKAIVEREAVKNPWSFPTELSNYASILFLIAAIAFWCTFAYWNVQTTP